MVTPQSSDRNAFIDNADSQQILNYFARPDWEMPVR